MVKNISCVSCAAWNVFPLNSLGTIVYNMYLCPNPSPLCTMKIDYGLNEMSSINETRRLRGFPREKLPSNMKEKNLRINYHIIKHSRFVNLFRNGILLQKLFWPTVRKNCSSDQEKLLKFEAEGSERSEQFLVTECFFNLFLEVSQI